MTRDEFIAQHTHKCYCEAVIAPNGDVEYAEPSHLYKLILVSKKTRAQLKKMMPMRAGPLDWLIEYTGYAVVWYDSFVLPYEYTDDQLLTIKNLMLHGIMCDHIRGAITQEKTTCELLDLWEKTGDETYLNKIHPKEPMELWR